MDKLFYNQDLMTYITTFIKKDPRKRYPEQEEKRQRFIQDFKSRVDYQEPTPTTKSHPFIFQCCTKCDTPTELYFHKSTEGYIEIQPLDEEWGEFCLECEKLAYVEVDSDFSIGDL